MGFGGFIQGVGKSLDEFGKNTLAPALSEARKTVDEFGRSKLSPALDRAGKALDEFGKNTLSPALHEAGNALSNFGQEKLSPALAGTAVVLDDFRRGKLDPALSDVGKALDGFGREKARPAVEEAVKWVEQHPAQTAMIAGGIVTFSFPGIVYQPLLAIFGFGSAGVKVGSAATAIQAANGPIAAGSSFAVAQSAAMGGYGSAVFGTIVQAGSAILSAAGLINAGSDILGGKDGAKAPEAEEKAKVE